MGVIPAKELKSFSDGSIFMINTITFDGQDFIDTIRQKHLWDITKDKAVEIGGFSLSLLVEIGKDYLKKQIGL